MLNTFSDPQPNSPPVTLDKTPLERAQLLETTPLFASIHAEMATGGQTSVPTDLNTDLHFTCFVAAPSEAKREALTSGLDPSDSEKQVELSAANSGMRLIELDGGRNGPIDRGKCDDLLKVRCEPYDVRIMY